MQCVFVISGLSSLMPSASHVYRNDGWIGLGSTTAVVAFQLRDFLSINIRTRRVHENQIPSVTIQLRSDGIFNG